MKKTTTHLIWLAALVAVLFAPTAGAAPFGSLAGKTTLLDSAPRQLAAASWSGGTYLAPDGEHVTIYVSTSYPEAESLAQHWADFFGSLPHGKELSAAKVYIAPLDQVAEMCFTTEALGCYGGQTLVVVGPTQG